MRYSTAYVNRELARWLPLLPPGEVKMLLVLMLAANAAGFLRSDAGTLATQVGEPTRIVEELLRSLSLRRLVIVRRTPVAWLILVNGFLGGRGAPRGAPSPLAPPSGGAPPGEPTEGERTKDDLRSPTGEGR